MQFSHKSLVILSTLSTNGFISEDASAHVVGDDDVCDGLDKSRFLRSQTLTQVSKIESKRFNTPTHSEKSDFG